MSFLGLGRPNLPGFSSTGPRSVNDWSADLVGHGGTGQAEIPCSNWRTLLTEHHRRSRVNTLRCSPPRDELALMPTVTGRVAATRSASRGGRRGQSAGLVGPPECITAESRTPCLGSKTKTNARTRRVPRRLDACSGDRWLERATGRRGFADLTKPDPPHPPPAAPPDIASPGLAPQMQRTRGPERAPQSGGTRNVLPRDRVGDSDPPPPRAPVRRDSLPIGARGGHGGGAGPGGVPCGVPR